MWKFDLLVLVYLSLIILSLDCTTVTKCSSSRRGYQKCWVPIKAKRIQVKEEWGRKECKRNKNYGIKSDHEIYVKNGCAGKFKVSCRSKRGKFSVQYGYKIVIRIYKRKKKFILIIILKFKNTFHIHANRNAMSLLIKQRSS